MYQTKLDNFIKIWNVLTTIEANLKTKTNHPRLQKIHQIPPTPTQFQIF